MLFCSLFRIPRCDLCGCVNALFFFLWKLKNNDTSVSCTCPEVWLNWSNRIAIAFTLPQSPHPILIRGGGNKHQAGVPSSSPTPPLSFLYGGALKAPLAALAAAPAAALAAAWRTAWLDITPVANSAWAFWKLASVCRYMPWTWAEGRAQGRWHPIRARLVHRHIAAHCAAAAAGGKMIRRTWYRRFSFGPLDIACPANWQMPPSPG